MTVATSPVTPLTKWTTPAPAKSINPILESHPPPQVQETHIGNIIADIYKVNIIWIPNNVLSAKHEFYIYIDINKRQ